MSQLHFVDNFITLGESVGIPCDYYLAQINHKSHLGLYFCDIWITEPLSGSEPRIAADHKFEDLRMQGNFSSLLFFKSFFSSKNCFRKTINISVSNCPNLGPNCLQMLSTDNKSCHCD